jgi:hypothetical protein
LYGLAAPPDRPISVIPKAIMALVRGIINPYVSVEERWDQDEEPVMAVTHRRALTTALSLEVGQPVSVHGPATSRFCTGLC